LAARKRFARSPQLYLREALGDQVDERALAALFIETEQYSERVVDVGLWEPPVLPWIKRDPNTWLPERFGIQIGDRYITLKPEDLPTLRGKVEQAIARGETTIQFDNQAVPATRRTLDALSSLIGEVKPTPIEPVTTTREPSGAKHVLIVNENFERVDYSRTLAARHTESQLGIPDAVLPTLKSHQISGLAYIQECWIKGYPGVLVADDMGLGKTLQALALLAWLREVLSQSGRDRRHQLGPFLVVAPTDLLENWIAEHNKHLFEPGLGELCRAYGRHLPQIKKYPASDVDTGIPALDTQTIRAADWVLTTYESLRDYHISFGAIRFSCVIFDEIQKVKNPASLNTRAAKTVNSDFVIGLTGTPIENQLEDLWSIMDIVTPGRLGDLKSFSADFRHNSGGNMVYPIHYDLSVP
jgi:SNF2 family DNA or RNA helicase